jgi:glycosyltransferase involved in cell wall biosynthesis
MNKTVSVVVPTRNSARTLGACVESIRRQNYAAVELIVVDNGSVDATREIAAAGGDAVIDAGPERSAQRNEGARRAKGEYLLFVDSDMVLEPDVVAECVAAVTRGAEAVVIPEVSFGRGFWARCKALERSFYVGDAIIEAGRFFVRDAFFRVGGYDETLTGPEDWDLHARMRAAGSPLARTRAKIRHDEGELRLWDLAAKKFHYGRTMKRYINRHPDLARRQLRVLRPQFFRIRALRVNPITFAGMIVMKTCEFGAGLAGILMASRRGAPD